MLKSKKFIKSIGFLLMVMFILCSCSRHSIVKVFANANNDYIVVLNEDSEIENQIKKQKKIEVKRTIKDNILVINTNTDEAKAINNLEGVGCIEKDNTVNGFSNNNKSNSKETEFWNLKMIKAYKNNKKGNYKVKIALIDSGIDVQEDLENNIVMRRDFLEEECSVLFEDLTGHGTSIASVLVGDNESVQGINKNIELYSARVLDENNASPISRVVEAIYWAIDNKVDIISLSFGTDKESKVLKEAVNEAEKKGILVIAASGNTNTYSNIYPAGYDTVLSVGAINSSGEPSEFSNPNADVFAPGESIIANGPFGAAIYTSGTSMSVPHVVGIASHLIEIKPNISPKLIRKIIKDTSIKKNGNKIVDCKYAEDIVYKIKNNNDISTLKIDDNKEDVLNFKSDENEVKGLWGSNTHTAFCALYDNVLDEMKKGATYSDVKENKIAGMTAHPDFHGYYISSSGKDVNVLASYRYLIKIANEYGKTGKTYLDVDASTISGLSADSIDAIKAAFKNRLDAQARSYSTNAKQKAFVFGIAMHTATDYFAHSTFYYNNMSWVRITHDPITDPFTKLTYNSAADNINFKNRRYTMAIRVARNNLYRYQKKRTDVPVCHDFHVSGDTTGAYYDEKLALRSAYRVANISKYAKSAGVKDSNVLKHFSILNITK